MNLPLPLLTVVLSSLLLAGCGGKPSVASTGDVTLADLTELPAPVPSDVSEITREYRIGPYDILAIDVFGIEDFARELQVDVSGRIGFPLAGSVLAAGKTPEQLANEIEGKLRDNFVRDPRVTVALKEVASAVVTVEGEVTRPGNYPVLGNMTLMRAVAAAEGLGEYADKDDVVVFRTVGGQRYAALYNLGAIRRGNYADPEIYPNDLVVVGESRGRRLFDTLVDLAPVITTPIIVISNNN